MTVNVWNCLACFSAPHIIHLLDKPTEIPHGQECEPANRRNRLRLQELFISVLVKVMHICTILLQNYSVMLSHFPRCFWYLLKSVKEINVTSSNTRCDIIVWLNKHWSLLGYDTIQFTMFQSSLLLLSSRQYKKYGNNRESIWSGKITGEVVQGSTQNMQRSLDWGSLRLQRYKQENEKH
jgi:hypothetical protein